MIDVAIRGPRSFLYQPGPLVCLAVLLARGRLRGLRQVHPLLRPCIRATPRSDWPACPTRQLRGAGPASPRSADRPCTPFPHPQALAPRSSALPSLPPFDASFASRRYTANRPPRLRGLFRGLNCVCLLDSGRLAVDSPSTVEDQRRTWTHQFFGAYSHANLKD